VRDATAAHRFCLDDGKFGRYLSIAMPIFLWTGKTATGQEEVERIEADTPEAARKILEARGWTDLSQQTMEIHDFAKAQVEGASCPEYKVEITPKQELAYLKGTAPGFLANWLKSLRESWFTILLIAVMFAFAVYRHRVPLMFFMGGLLAVVVLLFPALHWWFGRTQTLFRELHSARNWRRWDEVLQRLEQLKSAQRTTKIGIGEAEIARYRALALAGKGQLEEAVILFEAAAEQAKMPQWLYHVHLATIYSTAKQYDRGLEMYRLALDEATDKSVVWIDMGGFLVERFNRPAEARQLLALAETAQLAELARNYLPNLRGKIAYREGNFADMERHMREALAGYEKQPQRNFYMFEPVILTCKGYLAVACAALGKKDEAKKYFAEAGEYLSVTCLDEVVAHYHALMGQ